MNDIIQTLRDYEVIRDGDNLQHKVVEGVEPEFAPMSSIPKLDSKLARRLEDLGVEQLYKHQSEAINHAMAGKNVVLEAPTASGKTLSFAIPVLQSLVSSREGHALFIYPMKAVAADQRKQLLELHDGMRHKRGRPIESWPYDGDVNEEDRKVLRESPPSILLTNIEFINYSFLAFPDTWEKFLKDLRWIVIDEMHEYRGYFGTNAAMVLRRLVHHLAERSDRDSLPNYFLATATSENPLEHAANLTGQEFELVSSRDSLRPERKYIFVDPDIPDHQFWQILHLRASKAACALDDLGKSAIIFCPTRKFAETAYQQTRRLFADEGRDVCAVRVFRGGMTAEDRAKILNDMKAGDARFVFSTNALELGIDISGLDAVVMVGFPDNVMSARQQIGRAGRNWRNDGTVIYLARNNPLDSFFARHLDEFLAKPLDELVTDTGNEEIAIKHADCVWFETGKPDTAKSTEILGKGIRTKIRAILGSTGRGTPTGYGRPRYSPHRRVQIRGINEGAFVLESNGTEVGTMSSYQKFKEAYEGAIILHGGTRYRVTGTLQESDRNVVELTPEDANHHTEAFSIPAVSINAIFSEAQPTDDVEVLYCNVAVHETIAQVTEWAENSNEFINRWELDATNSTYRRAGHAATWKLDMDGSESPALLALEQLFRIGVGFVIPVDQHDFFTLSLPKSNEVYVIESFPGGIGIAARVFDRWQDILRQGIAIATNCDCIPAEGCPYCIVPPRRHDEMNKAAGLELAERLLELAG